MAALRLVLGDQLTRDIASLRDLDPEADLVVMAEVDTEATYVRHHKKKIAFVFSAMRHFAAELEAEGVRIAYTRIDDPDNTHNLRGEVARALEPGGFDEVVAVEPGEYRLREEMESWPGALGVPVQVRRDDRFICSRERFDAWAEGRKRLTMEYFYREMRRETGLLMEGDEPAGGRWNFDHDNRQALPTGIDIPERPAVAPDAITREVLDTVADRYADHFGDLEPFGYAVASADAEAQLDWFVAHALPRFGDYQDAMAEGEAFLFHSVLSMYLNAGLLDPMAVCRVAEQAWRDGEAPINAVEGFIRQVLGWREFVRGIYWRFMPGYLERNHLAATRPLPDFYWTGETDMACVADVVRTTRKHAYAHHIQRLMVTGNFALLAGVDPAEVNAWYLAVYADAYEWVEAPNTHGMALYADGGLMATKPYAAGGAYIDRMSNHCAGCAYSVKAKTGETACPFNYLYWNFLIENEDRLRDNHRLGMIYNTLDRMSAEKRSAVRADARRFFDRIGVAREEETAS
ncbi:cryptochrome/photolyase family protein [Marinicauda salina]|uniref:Cryptochrome/photolyase family protein n=1 Tax=Marinicauda salina TaxID=2135793 RepID=A0A2U2BVG5_9PROT|nr:cryptochrome/photolyase family protein [Marinicauda salina]PWE18021.1 cryptochrome/photolyase family protein [Marinicauda salina]